MELSFLENNAGAPLAHDVIAFAAELGFFPFSICGMHRIKGQFVQADVVFVRKSSPLRLAAEKSFRE